MNFFVRPKTLKKIQPSKKNDDYIVHYEVVDKLVKTNVDAKGNVDPDDYITQKTAVEVERYDRQEYINSFREDVGIENILKKVALSGDATLLNQISRSPLPLADDGKEIIQDITPLQEGDDALAAIGDGMRKSWDSLPDELKAGRSLEQFLDTISPGEVDAFVASYLKKKEGENNG